MPYIDAPQTGRRPIVNPELAVMSGQIKTTNVDDLRRFRRALNSGDTTGGPCGINLFPMIPFL